MSNPTLYINKINDSILFDEKNKEFTICDGSLGTYKFCDVVRSQIVYEHARYKGKSPLFSHRVLISTFNTSIFIELKKVYVGIEIELSNGEKHEIRDGNGELFIVTDTEKFEIMHAADYINECLNRTK